MIYRLISAANIGIIIRNSKFQVFFLRYAQKKAGLGARFCRSSRLTSLRIGTISAVTSVNSSEVSGKTSEALKNSVLGVFFMPIKVSTLVQLEPGWLWS